MPYKNLIQKIGFVPKENTTGIFHKKYAEFNNYEIEIDLDNGRFNYGKLITSGTLTTSNFSQAESWVVLECVNRLLEKGYKPKNISLEKVYPAGHGFSGRLDVCVTREDDSEYLLIECKTYGKEFDKAVTKLNKDGGQLFTYFKFSSKADVIMLYASELNAGNVVYKNEIVKIEDDYRTGDVKDFYDKWNKLTKDNGVFDAWVNPYQFFSKALSINLLEPIKQEDSSFIFNRFLEILRHNVVSDKPNAFNKIFTLFLCKIYDEKVNEGTENELGFQWIEGIDDDISFQLRLTDLYKNGMFEFLEKRVTDFSETEFERKFKSLDDSVKNALLTEFKKIRLEKNNEFAIKEVYDEKSFKENAKVVKEVVELLQGFKIRYTKKQQYLSDFFELLLTTGLKQESGQFFTPVPIAQFIIKSLPIDSIVDEKLQKGEGNNLLPLVMDYAAGSGHFLTETMHEMQRLIDQKDDKNYNPSTAKKIRNWKDDHFDWALDYVYGIEKDYRLVKVGKVGCYLHGDGLANVLHTDGLANFNHPDYKGKLRHTDQDFPIDNKQFDIIVSNPPYSVPAFKNASREYYRENDFLLYDRLTDNSSEIECLFIERTKQLLKDGGVAGIILPSSILNNTGIYTKSREIILQFFEIIAIAELGSNTFMATGTNTVTFFLRRKNNYESINLKNSVDAFFTHLRDVNLNGIEKPATKYVQHVWEKISLEDYKTFIQRTPNIAVQNHKLFIEYQKNIKAKSEKEFWDLAINTEIQKLYYFLTVYNQRVVLIKSGEKNEEKRFLGYEFSYRRGGEGIHAIQGGKNIEDCTSLFDPEVFNNPSKASTYIHKAYNGDFDYPIDKSLEKNVTRHRLVDMLTFDRVDFEKNISLSEKKKVKIESQWDIFKLSQLLSIGRGASPRPIRDYITNENKGENWVKIGDVKPGSKFIYETQEKVTKEGADKSRRVIKGDFILSNSMSFGRPYIMGINGCIHDGWLLLSDFNKDLNKDFLYYILSDKIVQNQFTRSASGGTSVDNLNIDKVSHTEIPLPPRNIQEKIVIEFEKLETEELKLSERSKILREEIFSTFTNYPSENISTICEISTNRENPQNNPNGEYIYLGLEHIESGTGNILINSELGINILSTKNIFKKGDILYGKLRPYLNKVAEPDFNGICSTDILVLKTEVPKLLKYALQSEDFVKQATGLMKGVSLPRIGIKDFLSLKISLPPISDQQYVINEIIIKETQIEALNEERLAIAQKRDLVLAKYL
jgi:type I restriction enzyme M protein